MSRDLDDQANRESVFRPRHRRRSAHFDLPFDFLTVVAGRFEDEQFGLMPEAADETETEPVGALPGLDEAGADESLVEPGEDFAAAIPFDDEEEDFTSQPVRGRRHERRRPIPRRGRFEVEDEEEV